MNKQLDENKLLISFVESVKNSKEYFFKKETTVENIREYLKKHNGDKELKELLEITSDTDMSKLFDVHNEVTNSIFGGESRKFGQNAHKRYYNSFDVILNTIVRGKSNNALLNPDATGKSPFVREYEKDVNDLRRIFGAFKKTDDVKKKFNDNLDLMNNIDLSSDNALEEAKRLDLAMSNNLKTAASIENASNIEVNYLNLDDIENVKDKLTALKNKIFTLGLDMDSLRNIDKEFNELFNLMNFYKSYVNKRNNLLEKRQRLMENLSLEYRPVKKEVKEEVREVEETKEVEEVKEEDISQSKVDTNEEEVLEPIVIKPRNKYVQMEETPSQSPVDTNKEKEEEEFNLNPSGYETKYHIGDKVVFNGKKPTFPGFWIIDRFELGATYEVENVRVTNNNREFIKLKGIPGYHHFSVFSTGEEFDRYLDELDGKEVKNVKDTKANKKEMKAASVAGIATNSKTAKNVRASALEHVLKSVAKFGKNAYVNFKNIGTKLMDYLSEDEEYSRDEMIDKLKQELVDSRDALKTAEEYINKMASIQEEVKADISKGKSL